MMFAMLLFDEVSDRQIAEDVRRRGGIIKDVLRYALNLFSWFIIFACS